MSHWKAPEEPSVRLEAVGGSGRSPAPLLTAFQRGERGDTLASRVAPHFDAKLYAWKRAFQIAHENCVEDAS